MKLIDSHCHLDNKQFAGDYEAVIERAQAVGVERLMAIGTGEGPPDLEAAVRLADSYPFFYATVGVHPHHAAKATRETGRPVVIHTREAWSDTIGILREHYSGGGIFHCFTGGTTEALQALDLGFHLSFGGVATFPKAEPVREAARLVPLDRLLVETDAPYLAPVPHRGKRNEPAFLVETVRKLAEIRGISPEELGAATTRNFERLCLR